jgi:hypothetical protein
MRYAGLLLLFICSYVFADQTVYLGDTKVIIKELHYGTGKSFIHLHQNESTALKAAKYVIAREGGSVLTLVHPGNRNIVFHLKNKQYEFDPNRIFTDKGIKKSLTQFGSYSPEAHKQVKKLATSIIKRLPPGKIIAVHNNNQSYSFGQYLPGHSLASQAQNLNVKDTCRCRNFYLVTQMKDYLRLKKWNFNEILQTKKPADDGSLSVYLAKREYINVEAGYNQLAAQVKMLQLA